MINDRQRLRQREREIEREIYRESQREIERDRERRKMVMCAKIKTHDNEIDNDAKYERQEVRYS